MDYPKILSDRRFKMNMRECSLSDLLSELQNSLPQDGMEDKSINHFKMKLDYFIEVKSSDGY